MKRNFSKHLLWPFFIVACLTFLLGCTSTKPNTPYSGPYPPGYNKLSKNNPLFAQELSKIPEIQDGIDEKDAKTLEKIYSFYIENKADFNSAFKQMYAVGIPQARKYCTPIQALYWLAEDDKLNQINLSQYDLKEILDQAWYKTGFEYDGKGRWDDFYEVTERLNSPFLVDYYASRNFTYKIIPGSGRHPRYIFRTKQGACGLYTSFSVYCLQKGGYEARAIIVKAGRTPDHVVCEYKDSNGEEYILDSSAKSYSRTSGIHEKEGFLKTFPYVGTR